MNKNNENIGLVGAVRQKAIGFPDLTNMERHGKREDASSQRRRVRDIEPLVYGSLDLTEERRAHMNGVKQSGRSACIHALVQFPTGLLDGAREDHQREMLGHAVEFLNRYHGGDAVFAARLDRDEKGRHTVDVFLMPRYDFHYKDGRVVKKASVSKFSKVEAKKRFGRTDRRSQGSALQDAFFDHLRHKMLLRGVQPPTRKKITTKDRIEPEEFGLRQAQRRLSKDAQQLAQADRIAKKRNKEKSVANDTEARLLEKKLETLSQQQKKLKIERETFEKMVAARISAIEKREKNVKRDAKTVRNIRLVSGQDALRSLNKIIDMQFENMDVR